MIMAIRGDSIDHGAAGSSSLLLYFAFCGVVKPSTAFAGLCRTVAVSTAQAGKHARSTSYLLSANPGKS